jgi:hypothetical protein
METSRTCGVRSRAERTVSNAVVTKREPHTMAKVGRGRFMNSTSVRLQARALE